MIGEKVEGRSLKNNCKLFDRDSPKHLGRYRTLMGYMADGSKLVIWKLKRR